MAILKRLGKNVLKYGKKAVKRSAKSQVRRMRPAAWAPTLNQDIQMIKKLINVEKKRIQLAFANNIGQYANTLNSFNILDLSPVISQGDAYNQRNGSSVKLVSYHMDMQLIHQSNTSQPVRGKVYIMLNKGQPILTVGDLQTYYSNIFVPNPFITGYGGTAGATGILDLNSAFNSDFYGRYKIIQSKSFYIQPDNLTSQPIYKTIKLGKKWQHHLRWDKNSNTLVNGQILMITLLDSGNAGGVTSTLTGVPVTQSSTGITQNINLTHYYVDN